MTPPAPDPLPPGAMIGLEATVNLTQRRIADYFAAPQREALVIGVFGEWGSGKSTLLKAIGEAYPNLPPLLPPTVSTAEMPADAFAEVTLRVEFNAWRFEREEHLLVPLLRTVQKTLADYLVALAAWQRALPMPPRSIVKRLVEWGDKPVPWAWLGERATLLGNCVIALTKMVKLKAGVPGLGEVELDPSGALEAAQKQIDRAREQAEKAAPSARDWQSLYYDLHTELHRLTRGSPGAGADGAAAGSTPPRLNFVFFIDDLDRCLPEKAVEMLEAIKLFLDIDGCAFVLAVDDEVVERGIAHRYRDYLGAGDRSAESIAYSLKPQRYREYRQQYGRASGSALAAPITGYEYLEKIIQLPIRLPRLARAQAQQLLESTAARIHAPHLFLPAAPYPGREPSAWLLDLFLGAVPLAPRKLIRAVELLDFVRRLAAREDRLESLHDYTLAQLVLLQSFAPQMFRDLARRRAAAWKRLEQRLAEAEAERVATGSPSFLAWWEERVRLDKAGGDPGIVKRAEVVEEPFIAQLRDTIGLRSGFDPRELFLHGFEVDDDLAPYFNVLVSKAVVAAATVPVAAAEIGPAPVVAATPVATPVATPAAMPGVPHPASVDDPFADIAAAPPLRPASRPAPAASVAAPASLATAAPATSPAQPEPVAPRRPNTFVDLLFAPDTATRIGAVRDEPALAGRVLDAGTVGLIVRRAAQSPETVNAAWLAKVGAYFADADVLTVLRAAAVLDRLGGPGATFAQTDELGRVLEWLCQRLRPWAADDAGPLDLGALGNVSELDPHRRGWAYRYLRGVRPDPLSPAEDLSLWPGFAPSVASDVRQLCEVEPGIVALSTAGGEVSLWSRALRGEWQLQSKVWSSGGSAVDVTPLSGFDLALRLGDGSVLVRHQGDDGRWQTQWAETLPHGATLLTRLAGDHLAMASGGTLRFASAHLQAQEQTRWQVIERDVAGPLRAIVPLARDRALVLGAQAWDVRDALGSPRYEPAPVGTGGIADAAAIGHALLCLSGSGPVSVWRLEPDGFQRLPDLVSGLSFVTGLRSNGTLALLIATEGVELWDCAQPEAQLRVGSGPVGAGPSTPLALLCDGSVLVATPTAVQRHAVNHGTQRFEFAETMVGVDPTSEVLADTLEALVIGRGDALFSLRVDEQQGAAPWLRSTARRLGTGPVRALADLGDGAMAAVESGNTLRIVSASGLASTLGVGLDRVDAIASVDDRLVAAGGPQLAAFKPIEGSWRSLPGARLDFDVQALCPGRDGVVLAWNASGRVAMVRPPTSPNTMPGVDPWGADRGAVQLGLASASLLGLALAPGPWLRGNDDPPDLQRFVATNATGWWVLQADARGLVDGPVTVDAMRHDSLRFAWPFGGERLLLLYASGDVHVLTMDRRTTVMDRRMLPSLRGAPLHAVPLRQHRGLLLRCEDDALYRLLVDAQGRLSVQRWLLLPPAVLLEQRLNEQGEVLEARVSPIAWEGQAAQPLVESGPPLRIAPAALRAAAWLRSNGRLAELRERPAALQVEDHADPTQRALRIR